MKKYIALCLATLCVCAANAQGSFDFKNAPIPMVLDIYAKLSEKQLVIESAVTNQTKFITVRVAEVESREQAAKIIASALQKQAGIIFEKIDEKRLAVKLDKK